MGISEEELDNVMKMLGHKDKKPKKKSSPEKSMHGAEDKKQKSPPKEKKRIALQSVSPPKKSETVTLDTSDPNFMQKVMQLVNSKIDTQVEREFEKLMKVSEDELVQLYLKEVEKIRKSFKDAASEKKLEEFLKKNVEVDKNSTLTAEQLMELERMKKVAEKSSTYEIGKVTVEYNVILQERGSSLTIIDLVNGMRSNHAYVPNKKKLSKKELQKFAEKEGLLDHVHAPQNEQKRQHREDKLDDMMRKMRRER